MDIPVCMELSRRVGRPVRMHRKYDAELLAGDPTHSMLATLRLAVSKDGRILGLKARTIFNAGAYGAFTPRPETAAVQGSSYRIPAGEFETYRVYTNEVPTGNMRAPQAPQITYSMEAMMSYVAHRLGLNQFEFRRRNLLKTGETNVNGDEWPEQRGIETLDLAERSVNREALPKDAGPNMRFGIGVALYDRPSHAPSATSQRLRILPGGMVEAQIGVPETGTGSHTMYQRVLADELDLELEQVAIRYVGTAYLPIDVGVGGQQVTVSGANGSVVSAANFRDHVASEAAAVLKVDPGEIEFRHGGVAAASSGGQITFAELAARGVSAETLTETPAADPHVGATNYAVQVAQVGVDVETGQVTIYDFVSAHDVAEIVEPISHQGQIEGGIAMGLGFALCEDLGLSDGQVTNAHLGDYKIISMADIPPLNVVLLSGGIGVGPRNVKSIGEMGNVPAAAAVSNAVSDALGICMDSLPLTAEKVRAASAL